MQVQLRPPLRHAGGSLQQGMMCLPGSSKPLHL